MCFWWILLVGWVGCSAVSIVLGSQVSGSLALKFTSLTLNKVAPLILEFLRFSCKIEVRPLDLNPEPEGGPGLPCSPGFNAGLFAVQLSKQTSSPSGHAVTESKGSHRALFLTDKCPEPNTKVRFICDQATSTASCNSWQITCVLEL